MSSRSRSSQAQRIGRSHRARVANMAAPKRSKRTRHATAQEMSAKQREISVAEFFQKNRHLLGFDNPRKALLTTVKEAVDNSLDACEEAGILPAVTVKIEVVPVEGKLPPSPAQATRFRVSVTDNGPGIVAANVGKVFAKLLYGSKFHRLRQSRGQQGIGISAAGMYGQLTTGKPVTVFSKLKGKPPCGFLLSIDTKTNKPIEQKREVSESDFRLEHGTQVAIELEGKYQRGKGSVDEYLELTSIANPHVELVYHAPDGTPVTYKRGVADLPRLPREIKPHPLGIELGMLMKMVQDTKSRTLQGFLSEDFVRVSSKVAGEVCRAAKLNPRMKPRDVVGHSAEALYKVIQQTKFMSPPTDCVSPIGENAMGAGLLKSVKADWYTRETRPPKVYRGNPFVIEVGLAFGKGDVAKRAKKEEDEEEGGEGRAEGEKQEATELATLVRFANRVPLIYQQSSCATHKAVLKTAWKNYGLGQSRGALPQGPLTIFIHMASVWVPFTSEAKEAIAEYDEIIAEVKSALQICGRRLGSYIRKQQRARQDYARRNIFLRYIEEVANATSSIKGGKVSADRLKSQLMKIAKESTGGEETDRLLKKNQAPEESAKTVELTEEGLVGAVPDMLPEALPAAVADGNDAPKQEELIEGATAKGPKRKRVADDFDDIPITSFGKQIAGKKKAKGKARAERTLFDEEEAPAKPKRTAKKSGAKKKAAKKPPSKKGAPKKVPAKKGGASKKKKTTKQSPKKKR